MDILVTKDKAPDRQRAANCNRPIRWNLEANGLTYHLVRGLAELIVCAACYAPTKADRRDLQGAAALVLDVANRLRPPERFAGGARG